MRCDRGAGAADEAALFAVRTVSEDVTRGKGYEDEASYVGAGEEKCKFGVGEG